jgi:SSS family solute:Na+ symporter
LDETITAPAFGLTWWDGAAVVAYLLITFGVSLWFSRQQHSTDDFFVGGRRVPWLAVGLSILATLFSTLSYTGSPGEAVKNGIGLFLGYLAVPLNVLVIGWLWIPFYMRLRLTSAYEYLERRFDPSLRKLGAVLFILLRIGWMSMVIFVASLAVDSVKGVDLEWLPGRDLYWLIALIGLIAAVYTSLGGIEAIIWVDVLQCALLLFGVLMVIGYVTFVDGTGPGDWWAIARDHAKTHTAPPLFSWDLTIRVTIVTAIINNFFWNICTHGSDQVVLQRYFSTTSATSARRSFFTNVLVDFGMALLLFTAGFALLAFYLKHPMRLPDGKTPLEMADKLFPYFLGHQLPVGCAGLILSAFLCDAIQTLESGVNSIVVVVTRDLLPRRDGASTALGRARVWSAVLPLLVAGNAYGIAFLQDRFQLTIIDMMPKFFNMFVGPLAAMFFIGMFQPRSTARSVWPAVLLGLSVSIIWNWWEAIFGTPWRPTIGLAIALPCVTTFFSAAFLSVLLDRHRTVAEVPYCWWSVLRQPAPEPPVAS